jgi:hypothetical protein
LIEVLISIALLAIMMASIVTITNSSIETKDKILTEDFETTQVETALNRLADDIYQIYSPLYFSQKDSPRRQRSPEEGPYKPIPYTPTQRFPFISEKGQPIPLVDSPDPQTLIFLANSNRRKIQGIKQSDYVWIKYTLKRMEEESNRDAPYELVRYFDPNNVYAAQFNFDDVKPQILLRNIREMEFKYWDGPTERYVDSIRDLTSGDKIVTAVKLRLGWADKEGRKMETDRIFDIQWPLSEKPSERDAQEGAVLGEPNP